MIRAALLRHFRRVSCAAGAAALDAQRRGDWHAAGAHLARMHRAQAHRSLLEQRDTLVIPARAIAWYGAGVVLATFAFLHLT